jgi:RNA polymerase sigma factor for flagellar operon FliA
LAQHLLSSGGIRGFNLSGDRKSVLLTEFADGSNLIPAPTRDELILENVSLIKYHAYRLASHLPPNVEINDLISAGVIGLMDAAEKFDRSRGVQFQTYAAVRIRGAMIDSLRALDWAPQTLRRKGRKLQEAADRLQQRLGREASQQEICKELEMGLEELQQLHLSLGSASIGSLEDPHSADTLPSFDAYPDSTTDGPYLQFVKQELKAVVTEAVDRLGPKERLVVSLYYFEELTMKEIAAVLDVNESRVSQIHTKAMTQLRRKLKDSGYSTSAQRTNTSTEAQDDKPSDYSSSSAQTRHFVSKVHS